MTTVTSAQASELIDRIRRDPPWFFREVLGAKTYPKQDEIVCSVRDHRRTSVVGCNGSGKDWTTGRLIIWWLASYEQAKVIVMGPTNRQIEEIVWNEARVAFKEAARRGTPLGGKMYEGTAEYHVSEERFAIGFATDNPYNIQGFHSPHLLVIITEAHNVAQTDIETMKLLNPERIVMTGNSLSLYGEFFNAHTTRSTEYETVTITAYDTPNVIEDRVVIPGMMTREDIEERKREWGEDSPMYRASVLAKFTPGAGRNFFALEHVERLRRHVETPRVELRGGVVKVWRAPVVGTKYIAGGDFAWGEKGAYDHLVIADWRTLEEVAQIHGRLPDDEMAYESVKLLTQYNRAFFGGEVNSEGRHVIDKMLELSYGDRMYHRDGTDDPLVRLANGLRPPKKPGFLTDARTRPIMLAEMEEAVRGDWMIPHDEEMLDEMMWFIRDEKKNTPGPAVGHYSDRIMSWAIMMQMRSVATFVGGAQRKPAFAPKAW